MMVNCNFTSLYLMLGFKAACYRQFIPHVTLSAYKDNSLFTVISTIGCGALAILNILMVVQHIPVSHVCNSKFCFLLATSLMISVTATCVTQISIYLE